uniref:Uncharacterized protein n=1 Tax=Eutreptiella gymnastica TaxID=73025 RepID=A0A7S1IUV0_9EUGL
MAINIVSLGTRPIHWLTWRSDKHTATNFTAKNRRAFESLMFTQYSAKKECRRFTRSCSSIITSLGTTRAQCIANTEEVFGPIRGFSAQPWVQPATSVQMSGLVPQQVQSMYAGDGQETDK